MAWVGYLRPGSSGIGTLSPDCSRPPTWEFASQQHLANTLPVSTDAVARRTALLWPLPQKSPSLASLTRR